MTHIRFLSGGSSERGSSGVTWAACRLKPMCAVAGVVSLTVFDAAAQTTAPAPQILEPVVVTGPADGARSGSALHTVVPREELTKFADPTVADALRRVPGITVSGSAAGGLEIRMRGLGEGYTQILINGEPVPLGFSWASLSPDLVERIEISRAASADTSNQAIAGSINIVLRRAIKPGELESKLTASSTQGLGSGTLFGQSGLRWGELTAGLGLNVSLERDRWPATSESSAVDSSGTPLFLREGRHVEDTRSLTTGLTPRLVWKPQDNRSLSLDGLLQYQDSDYRNASTLTTLQGAPPDFPQVRERNNTDWHQSRLSAVWKSPVASTGRLELKSTLSLNSRRGDANFLGSSNTGESVLARHVASHSQDDSLSLQGKLSFELLERHDLAVGLDAQHSKRTEHRVQKEQSSAGYPTRDLDETYKATVNRAAAFLQDEWEVAPGISSYLGIRSETLSTDTSGDLINPVAHRSSVLSPVAKLLWNLNEEGTRQLSLALSRTYKPPLTRELIPRRWLTANNSPTSPNFQGNPELLPELAWGIDVGFETELPANGSLSVGGYLKRIDNVILPRVFLDSDNTWVSTPTNNGRADLWGLEVDTRTSLRAWFPGPEMPDIQVRLGLARNESRVRAVPGPDNRLQRQPSFTANLGLDWKLASLPLTMSISSSYEQGVNYRSSETTSGRTASKRNLGLSAVWAIEKGMRLRLSIDNVTAPSEATRTQYEDADLLQQENNLTEQFVVARLQLELKF